MKPCSYLITLRFEFSTTACFRHMHVNFSIPSCPINPSPPPMQPSSSRSGVDGFGMYRNTKSLHTLVLHLILLLKLAPRNRSSLFFLLSKQSPCHW